MHDIPTLDYGGSGMGVGVLIERPPPSALFEFQSNKLCRKQSKNRRKEKVKERNSYIVYIFVRFLYSYKFLT